MIIYAILSCFLLNCVNGYFTEEECLNYTVYPVQYDIILVPYILSEEILYYHCEVTINVIANAAVREIQLDARDLEIYGDSVGVWHEGRNIINNINPYVYDKNTGKLHLYLKEDLTPYRLRKDQYYIKISLKKHLNYKENGIFIVRYDELERERYILATRISPNYAKNVFPCFDNPQFEAVYKFKIYIPSQRAVYPQSSSLVISQEMRRYITRDNYTVIEYMPSPQISTYQLGIHLSDFKKQTKKALFSNDSIALWAPSTNMRHYTYIIDFGINLLDAIIFYSEVKLPVTNDPINLIPLPTNINDYEKGNWNLLSNGDHKMEYLIRYTSAKQKEAMSFDLAQQLSRIWLGNPGEIMRTRWKEEWFKEGMATYFAYYFLSQLQGNEHFWDMNTYALEMRHNAMNVDWQPSTPTLSSFNDTLAVLIPAQYEQLITMKTAALLWMVENWLGSSVFHKSLKYYIKSRRGKFVSIDDFAQYLQTESVHCEFFKGYTVSNVLSTWMRQPGYPVVNVRVYRKSDDQDSIYLEQRHFSFNNGSRQNYKYLIPISYVKQYNEDCYNCFQPKFTISDSGYTFKENLNNGWIILNRNASGYYRVNYDSQTWNYIVKTLTGPQREQIDPYNRAQIVNDAFALYMAGDISIQQAQDILNCLDYENNYMVWKAAFDGFNLLKTNGASVTMSKELYNNWKMFMREKISMIYSRGVNDINRDHQTRLFKSEIINFACTIDHTLCLKHLDREIEKILNSGLYDPDVRQTCYYKLLNRSDGWDVINKKDILNRFEKEDALTAEELSKREVLFNYNLPNKSVAPMPLTMSTTPAPPEPMPTTLSLTTAVPASTAAAIYQSGLLISLPCVLLFFILQRIY